MNRSIPHNDGEAGLRTIRFILAAGLSISALIVAILFWEYTQHRNLTTFHPLYALLGPLTMAVDPAPANKVFGIIAAVVLSAPATLLVVFPRWTLVFVVFICAWIWMLLGALGLTIDV